MGKITSMLLSSTHGAGGPRFPAATGPLMGLVYIIITPFIGAFASILLCSYQVSRSTAALWHK